MGTVLLIAYFVGAGVFGSIIMRILSGGYPDLADDNETKEFLNMSNGKKILTAILSGAFWPALIGLGLLIHFAGKGKE